MNVKRSRLSILADILKLVRDSGGMKPTHILYKANLSHPRMKKHLTMLIEGGFIEAVEGKGIVYRITKKGDKFVSEIRKIEKLSEAFGVPM